MLTHCTKANWNSQSKPGQEDEPKGSQGNWQVQERGKDTEQETIQGKRQVQEEGQDKDQETEQGN